MLEVLCSTRGRQRAFRLPKSQRTPRSLAQSAELTDPQGLGLEP